MAEGPRRRLQLVGTLLIGCVLVIVAQLAQVQVVDHQFYVAWAREIRERPITAVEPPRGVIRDRNGYLLAGNAVEYAIEASPAYVVDPSAAAEALSPLLHIPSVHIKRMLDSDRVWTPILSPVSKTVGEEVAALGLPGVNVRPLWVREYPEGRLASHLIGFCNREGVGFYGVEGFHNALLQPVQVAREGPVDPASEQVPWTVAPVIMPQPGAELILTIDRSVQAMVEEELARAIEEHRAAGGVIIVMDPRTFDVLALASQPDYNPGRYSDFYNQSPLPFNDPAVSKQYEPGSVFKVLTVAAAIDAGLVAPETTYHDQGWIEIGGALIKNAIAQPPQDRTVADILIRSLNVGAARLSSQMGADLFYRYLLAFGIGKPTGVDLAGEAAGQLWLPKDVAHWHDSNLGTNAFGQGLAVTPIQMISAVATVANEGARLRPHVVAERVAADGSISRFRPVIEDQAISPETARLVVEIMERTVTEKVNQAQVAGYRVAGKTGTSQIPIPGGYDPRATVASFVGFGPVSDPQVVVLVKLDNPQTSTWGADTAAPTFARVASRLFVLLGIPPDDAPGGPDGMEIAEVVVE